MSSPAEQAKSILVGAGIGSASDAGSWPIRVSLMPSSPDAQITIYDSPGEPPNPKWLLDYPFIQAMVRGDRADYSGARQKAKDVKDCLLGRDPTVVDGDRWDGVTMAGDIAFLQYDDVNRPLFSLNFRVIHEPADNALTTREPL